MFLLYDVTYNEDGTIKSFTQRIYDNAPDKVKKQIEINLSQAHYPTKPLVPFIKGYSGQSSTRDSKRLYPWL